MSTASEEIPEPLEAAAASFERRLPAVPISVPRLRAELTAWVRSLGIPPEIADSVRLAVTEALTNAVVHAFVDMEPGTVGLFGQTGPGRLEIRVCDDGRGMGPRPDSPGLGMGVPMIGKLCSSVDLGVGLGGQGTEVHMVFAAPGLVAPAAPGGGDDLEEILEALAQMTAGEGFAGADISGLVDLLVPRLADLCSITLLEVDGSARRLSARVARPDGSLDPDQTDWTMRFPIIAAGAPSLQAAQTGRVSLNAVDEEFAARVSPDADRARELMALDLAWWAAVPLQTGKQSVGSISVAGRHGRPEPVMSTLERIAEQAATLVATARLVADMRRTQGHLEGILGTLTEAVTVRGHDGRIVYANQAAADLLGQPSVDAVLASLPGEMAARFAITDEQGAPVELDGLPPNRLAAGLPAAPLVTRSIDRVSGQTRWLRTTATRLDDGELIVSVIQDVTAVKDAEVRRALVAEAADTLAQRLGRPDTFARVAELVVPWVADGCVVDLIDEAGSFAVAAAHHADADQLEMLRAMREAHPPDPGFFRGAGKVLRDGTPDVLNDLTDELLQIAADDDEHLEMLRALRLRAAAVLPMVAQGRLIGVLTLFNDVSGRNFADADIASGQDIAGRVAVAVDGARRQAESERTQEELLTSLARLQLLADAGFGGVTRGVGDTILNANATFLTMLGYEDVAELPPWPQMTPAEWSHQDARAVRQLEEHGTADVFEKEYIRRDVTRLPVLIGTTAGEAGSGEWIAVVVDLSSRRAEQRRRTDELSQLGRSAGSRAGEGVADVVESLAAAVLIQRPGEGIVYANQAAAEIMQVAASSDLLTATLEDIAQAWESFEEDGTPLDPSRFPSHRVLAGEEHPPPLTMRTVNRRSGREYWRVVRARGVYHPDGRLVMSVSTTEDITDIKRAALMQQLLAQAGEVLSSSVAYEHTLAALAELTIPGLADWCSIAMPDEHGVIHQVAVAHADPDRTRVAREQAPQMRGHVEDDSAPAMVLRGGPPVLVVDIAQALAEGDGLPDRARLEWLQGEGVRSVIRVPLTSAGGAPIGVMTLAHAESGRTYAPADLTLALELGRRAGAAVRNAQLHGERAHIAATLQASLLPDALPDVPGYALASTYRPAGRQNWVGGDFYDVFEVPGGWMAIMGDVAGHGAEAAALTAQARHTLRAIGEAFGDPVRAVEHLNRLLVPQDEPALCTVCAVLVTDDGAGGAQATITCAGHPLPFLVREGSATPVGRWGALLGAWDSTFTSTTVDLDHDDLLVLYTDGVLDTRGAAGRFGEQRLHDVLTASDGADDAIARVQAALDDFQKGEQADDTAVLAIRRCPD